MYIEWLSLCVVQVKRIDYYQRTDQALSQFLSGASAHSLSTDVTTYLHGDGLLTLRVARLPEGQELPGADTDQVWFWLRPRQVGKAFMDSCLCWVCVLGVLRAVWRHSRASMFGRTFGALVLSFRLACGLVKTQSVAESPQQ